jgi:protein-disulfide isomerase
MRPFPFPIIALALMGLFSVGASCNTGREAEAAGKDGPQPAAAQKIEKLERVDTSSLTDTERRTWVDLVNELLSPCGEPVSVAQCVAESRACSACVPGARYLVRLVSEGYERAEISELFAARYDPKQKVTLNMADSPMRGAPMAKVTIVEFSDFECPHCGAAHPVLSGLLQEYDGKVNLVFKNFPLDGHKNAMTAAMAAVSAGKQGKFWEMADKLFEHQRELSPEKIRALAQEIGLDMTRFDADMASPAVRERVEQDKKEGIALNIQGTPTLFVNNRPFREGAQHLSKYLREELAQ